MSTWLLVIIVIICVGYILDCLTSLLNLSSLDPQLPDEFKGVFKQDEYARSQSYTRDRIRFSLVSST